MNQSRMASPSVSNLKIDRELQNKLYTNIALLTMTHEPSDEFKSVFKKDMFARSNKAAFLHVVHYLLTVLNPQLAKEKLVTWPTCNIVSRENKFRNEVLQCINEINKIYEEADLPVMMSSHLLAPGGYRFNHFMYKLSQLVLLEDIKREYPSQILCRPKLSKNEELNEKAYQNIMKYTEEINLEINQATEKFQRILELFQQEADKTMRENHEIHKEMKELSDKIAIEEALLKEHKLSDKDVAEKLKEIEEKYKTIENLNNIYTESKNLIKNLQEIGNDNELLNIAESLKATNINMRRQLSELPDYEIEELESYLQMLNKKKEELDQVQINLKIKDEALVKAMNASEDVLKNVLEDLKDI